MRAYLDADILIWHLRGERKAKDFLRRLIEHDEYDLWTGALQRAEVVFFMRPEEEERTLLLLAQFQTAVVDQAVIDRAAQFYRQWNPSHGTDIHDAILAATAAETGGKIYCLNVKHYPMPDLVVERAW